LTFTQCAERRPLRYSEPGHLETMPSQLRLQAYLK
jgi:hypothetical protein